MKQQFTTHFASIMGLFTPVPTQYMCIYIYIYIYIYVYVFKLIINIYFNNIHLLKKTKVGSVIN